MQSLLPDLEGWIKAASAVVAVLMAILVPIRSWIVEDRRYRAQALDALAAASRSTVAGVSMPTSALADTLALSTLAESLDRVADALECLLAAEDERDRDRLTRALERVLDLRGREGA